MNSKLVRRKEFQQKGLWLNSSSCISSAHMCSSLYYVITLGRFKSYLRCAYMHDSLHYLQILWPLQWEKEAHRTQLQHQSSVRFANKLKSHTGLLNKRKLFQQFQIFEKVHTFVSNLNVSEGMAGRKGFLKPFHNIVLMFWPYRINVFDNTKLMCLTILH